MQIKKTKATPKEDVLKALKSLRSKLLPNNGEY